MCPTREGVQALGDGSPNMRGRRSSRLFVWRRWLGIVLRKDGKADLYSGVGDTYEGRVTIDNPFAGLL